MGYRAGILQIVTQSNPSRVRTVLTATVHVLQITVVTVFFLGRTYYVGTDFACVKFVRHNLSQCHHGKKQRSCRLNWILPTENTRNQTTWLWYLIQSVNPAWISLPSRLSSLRRKSENYNSADFRLYEKVPFLCLCYIGTSFKYWFCFLLHPVWYLEIFVCLNFSLQYFLDLHVYVSLSYL
jgi:hypothetical protein